MSWWVNLHASEMTGQGGLIYLNGYTLSLVSLEHLVYSFFSFKISVDVGRFPYILWYLSLRWTEEATISNVVVIHLPIMQL